jgi:photosystem II stability/assembly factor-like uncharacterized protein
MNSNVPPPNSRFEIFGGNMNLRNLIAFFAVVLIFTAQAYSGNNVWTTNGPEGGIIQDLAIDPSNTAVLYGATYHGGIFKSTDGGANWFLQDNGNTKYYLYSIAINPVTTSTVYAGGVNGAIKSTDGGQTWSDAGAATLFDNVVGLAVDPSDPQTVYAATEFAGIFRSTNGGNSWTAINTGLTNLEMTDVVVDPNSSTTLY